MPLNAFLCLKRTGRMANDKFVIVLQDGTTLTGGTTFIEPYPDIGFCLHKDYWTDVILKACAELRTKFEAACTKLFRLSNVTALIQGSSCHTDELQLPPGSRLTVVLRYRRWDTVEVAVTFDSPIADLQPC
jgi:hypothetical protein